MLLEPVVRNVAAPHGESVAYAQQVSVLAEHAYEAVVIADRAYGSAGTLGDLPHRDLVRAGGAHEGDSRFHDAAMGFSSGAINWIRSFRAAYERQVQRTTWSSRHCRGAVEAAKWKGNSHEAGQSSYEGHSACGAIGIEIVAATMLIGTPAMAGDPDPDPDAQDQSCGGAVRTFVKAAGARC